MQNDTAKGVDSKRQRSSVTNDTDRQGKRRKTKGGLEENEFCLDETAKVLTLGTGELGLASKIVGYVQDYFRLESIERIKQSNYSAGLICLELEKLVDAEVGDEAFVKFAIYKLFELVDMETGHFPQLAKFLEKNGLDLVGRSMTLHPSSFHPSSSSAQALGFCVLSSVSLTCHWSNKRELTEGRDINKFPSFLVSKPCTDMAVRALENHQDVHSTVAAVACMISAASYSLDSADAEETGRLNPQYSYQYLKDTHLQCLQQANVLPLCWSLLPKYITQRSFLTAACYILTLPVGGVDRPVLKKLLAQTPQVDELLAKVAEVGGNCIMDQALIELHNEYNAVRGQAGP